MTAEHTAIAKPLLPAHLEPELAEAGIHGTVLVQSACSHEDTEFMLALADEHEWIRGVVAWVDGVLAWKMRPSSSTATQSVNVPPISTPR